MELHYRKEVVASGIYRRRVDPWSEVDQQDREQATGFNGMEAQRTTVIETLAEG